MKITKKALAAAEQAKVNTEILKAIENLNNCKYSPVLFEIKSNKLRNMQACVFEYPQHYILKSYNTFIACIDKNTGICYDFLRYVYGYTATSAKHVNAFYNDYNGKKLLQYR